MEAKTNCMTASTGRDQQWWLWCGDVDLCAPRKCHILMYLFVLLSRSTHVDDLLLSSSAVEKGSALAGNSVDHIEVRSITILAVISSR